MTAANETSAGAATSSSNTAKAALEVSERAYVGIISVVMDRDLTDGQESKITVTIANGGRTPAFSMRTKHYYSWGPAAVPNPRTYAPLNVVSTDILIPSVEAVQASDKVANLHEPSITLIRDGTILLEAYGIIEFTDVFKKKRFTKYCYRYDPANPTAFIVCPEGNESNYSKLDRRIRTDKKRATMQFAGDPSLDDSRFCWRKKKRCSKRLMNTGF
jgi:hypothetical protein